MLSVPYTSDNALLYPRLHWTCPENHLLRASDRGTSENDWGLVPKVGTKYQQYKKLLYCMIRLIVVMQCFRVLYPMSHLYCFGNTTIMLYIITGRCCDLTGCDLLPGQSGFSTIQDLFIFVVLPSEPRNLDLLLTSFRCL